MSMKYQAAYLMAVIGGKESPSASDVKHILEAGGIEIDEEMLNLVISKAEGKNVSELITAGMGKNVSELITAGMGKNVSELITAGMGKNVSELITAGMGKKVEEEEEEEEMDFDFSADQQAPKFLQSQRHGVTGTQAACTYVDAYFGTDTS
eukprot:CAMPEP_0206486572 /NCGR_PEP_ID=MMETSP0324_2-20121206/41119_1 /ASSEMBLY_ACC=CAM_ASM_000836 /TAXON_ID=2866 /ORGANISM="Crypthecodinium cohnii, Strain Seligo" /LENGTH=150 /DNA_ID=CAMNT_0053964875 /DNA_START=5 /DNA_END=454 /DNA_ORIENTATION=+